MKTYIVGNWKMNFTVGEASIYLHKLLKTIKPALVTCLAVWNHAIIPGMDFGKSFPAIGTEFISHYSLIFLKVYYKTD